MKEQEPVSGLQGSLAGAREPTVDRRSDLPDSPGLNDDAPDTDLQDISKILLGAQAINGKTLTAAARMTVNPQQQEQQETLRKAREKEARELANLAAWGAKTTTVGGVQMTNEQAQRARQNVINNGDAYANWAVRKGMISEDEKDTFKTGIRRKMELEDKRGRGTLTTAEAAEEARLDQSRVGKAIDAATAESHLRRGRDNNLAVARQDTDEALARRSSAASSIGNTPFQSAPEAERDFNRVAAGRPPAPDVSPAPAPKPDQRIQATGFGV